MNFYPLPEQPTSSYSRLDSGDYELVVRQQPREALVTQAGKEKSRKPIDPPPIVELKVTPAKDPIRQYLQSPYLFMTCSLVPGAGSESAQTSSGSLLCGQMVSSLHRLKDVNNEDGGFFVFGDISVRLLGRHQLLFSLFELRKESGEVVFLKSCTSDLFDVVQQKQWRGLEESTYLSRAFSDQGVRLRLRKENRTMAGQSMKRPFPQDSARAGPSRYSSEQQTPPVYGTSQVTGQFDNFAEVAPKRQRSGDYDQSAMFAPPGRVMTGYEARAGPSSSVQSGFPLQSAPREALSYGMHTPTAPSGWQQGFYTPTGSTASSARVIEGGMRMAQATPPSGSYSMQHGSLGTDSAEYYGSRRSTDSYSAGIQTSPPGPYQTGEAMYAQQLAGQPSGGSSSGMHTPGSTSRSVLNPSASAFQIPSQQGYGGMQEATHYGYNQPPPQYRQPQQYPSTSSSLLQQPISLRPMDPGDPYGQAQQQQHPEQYDDLQHGYPSIEGPEGRDTDYSGSGRHWQQGQ